MIKSIICQTNKEFLNQYQNILDDNEDYFQLFIANLSDKDSILKENQLRGGIYINDRLSLLFLNAWPFNIQLYSFDHNINSIKYLVDYLIINNIPFKGVSGCDEDCKMFIDEYNQKTNIKFNLFLKMDIMRLTKLKEIVQKGFLQKATIDNIEEIINMRMAFHQESLNETIKYEDAYQATIKNLNNNSLYLYKNNYNQTTGMIYSTRKMKKTISLSLVYTKPIYRCQGYACSMVYDICQKIFKENENIKIISLFVDQNNPISNHVYKKVGFEIVRNNMDYRIINDQD